MHQSFLRKQNKWLLLYGFATVRVCWFYKMVCCRKTITYNVLRAFRILTETRTTTLLYEQSQRQSQTFRRDPAHVRAIIEDLVTSIPNTEVRPGVASRFAKLVFAMRRLDKESLRAIWLDYYNCEMSHDFCRTKEEKLKYQ